MTKAAASSPRQDDLPLLAVQSHRLFPGRALLRVEEVAEATRYSLQHILNLIAVGRLVALDFSTGNAAVVVSNKKGNRRVITKRQSLRIPVTAFDSLVQESRTDHDLL